MIAGKIPKIRFIRFTEIAGMLGSLWLIILSTIEMNTSGLVKTVHSALHLMISLVGLLILVGLVGIGVQKKKTLRGTGSLALTVTFTGLILYSFSNFTYAIFHGLLDILPNQNDPIVDISLFLGVSLSGIGPILLGFSFLTRHILTDKLCLLLIFGALIFSSGNLLISPKLYQLPKILGYLAAFLIILPFGSAWFRVIHEIHSQKQS